MYWYIGEEMIEINNTLYELDLIDIIKELKEQLTLNHIYLFNTVKELPEDLMVNCPFISLLIPFSLWELTTS